MDRRRIAPPETPASLRSTTGNLGSHTGATHLQHVIGDAVGVARLVGVPPPVHVHQIESSNGPQHLRGCEEFLDRGGVMHIDAEHVLTSREEPADVLGLCAAMLEQDVIHLTCAAEWSVVKSERCTINLARTKRR
jgi:hypothetical protein